MRQFYHEPLVTGEALDRMGGSAGDGPEGGSGGAREGGDAGKSSEGSEAGGEGRAEERAEGRAQERRRDEGGGREPTKAVHAFGFPWRNMAAEDSEVVCFNVVQMAFYAAKG